jgi:ribose/xylose/arabinose/galactoside ABC-type transport system permease subunit
VRFQSRRHLWSLLLRYTTPIMFIAVFLLFGLQEARFFQAQSVINIVKQASFIGIAAVGMTFVLLTAGIDLSVGAIMYLAPLVAGFTMRYLGLEALPALFVALLVGVLLGGINAFCIVRLKIIPFIVTLSTLFLFRGAGTFLTQSRQLDFPRGVIDFGLITVLGVPLPVVLFAAVVLIAHLTLTRTSFGRQVYAVGNDLEAAKKAGIPTGRIVASVYIVSGVCAALGGFMLISQIGRLDQGFGEGREFDIIAAAVLGGASLFGGVGSAFSAVIGALLVQTVKAGLVFTGVNLYLQPMVQGGIIFLAVFLDSLRETNLKALKRRFIRSEA